MSQDTVYELLKQNKKWMTIPEIAKELKMSDGAVNKNLRGLRKSQSVERKHRTTMLWEYKAI